MPKSDAALLLIDLQVDFLHPDGRLPVEQTQMPTLLESAERAIADARKRGEPIVAIQNAFHRWDPGNLFRKLAAIDGSSGAALDPRLDLSDAVVFTKAASSAFSNPELAAYLEEHDVRTLRIAGVFANGCVAATVKAAVARGYGVQLISDAIAARSSAARTRGIASCLEMGAVDQREEGSL